MNTHDCVQSCEPLDNQDDYVYLVHRNRGLPDVRVQVSDAYQYSRAEYLARPKEVQARNSFVVLGLPHATDPSTALIAEAKDDGLGVGAIGKFMGALNSRNVWEYETPEERRERERPPRRGVHPPLARYRYRPDA